MRVDDRLVAAVRSNARWCDLVCRSHHLPTMWGPDTWSVTRRSPPLYPDAVTLRAGCRADEVLARVEPGSGTSVKDSFHDLDLRAAGFACLLTATWIFAPPQQLTLAPAPRWDTVREPDDLAEWGRRHGGAQFPAGLLDAPDVRFLAAREAGRIVAGAVAVRGADAIDVSNVFTVAEVAPIGWPEVLGAVTAALPGAPLVGYESGDDLTAARAAGFTAIGPLRVWRRP